MRRTTRRLSFDTPADGRPVPLASIRCHVCGAPLGRPGSLVALGSDDAGALELGWCSARHAGVDGWPRCYPTERRLPPRGFIA